ncbi:MAG: hypothetical protein WC791_02285 [Candidatus Paceibacterota bacterium]|jgi:hypothetical protein
MKKVILLLGLLLVFPQVSFAQVIMPETATSSAPIDATSTMQFVETSSTSPSDSPTTVQSAVTSFFAPLMRLSSLSLNSTSLSVDTIFSDDFDDNTIDPTKWTTSGYGVVEQNGEMNVSTDVTDNGGILASRWIPVNGTHPITVSRRTMQHAGNQFYNGFLRLFFDTNGDGVPDKHFGVDYANNSYSGYNGTYCSRYGFFLDDGLNWQNGIYCGVHISNIIPAIWNTWFDESLTYDPATGLLTYLINDTQQAELNVGALPVSDNYQMQVYDRPWGWGTGHFDYFDDLVVTQGGATPDHFWAEISNESGAMKMYELPNTTSTELKQLPSGWAVEVKSTKKDGSNAETIEGGIAYRWYQVRDATDGTTGWMKAGVIDNATGNFIDGQEYLKYEASMQTELENTASQIYGTKEDRANLISDAVNHYYINASATPSLSSSDNLGKEGANNISLLRLADFPKQLILAIFANESDIVDFDNENVARDFGHGISQVTTTHYPAQPENDYDKRGVASGIDVPACSLDNLNYLDCYTDSDKNIPHSYKTASDGYLYKFYTNTKQSIFSNVKDGMKVLRDKFNIYYNNPYVAQNETWTGKLDENNITYKITKPEMEQILGVRGYNGFGPDPYYDENGNKVCRRLNNQSQPYYLAQVANKLETIKTIFPNSDTYSNPDNFIEKLKLASQEKETISICSPGTLEIVDSEGRSSGLNTTGVKNDVPNVYYDQKSGKQAEVYFPNGTESYKVSGTEEGLYSFYVDGAVSNIFSAINIPLKLGEIYTYKVDSDALSRGERGVTVLVDENGDGTPEQTIQVGNNFSDTVAPMTTSVISGSLGVDYWYTSPTSVALTAVDNIDGVGVEKTMYSLDNGVTWNTYSTSTPLVIATEGTSTLKYYSVDYFGNTEATSTLDFKIDTTAPTIFASDTSVEQLTSSGTLLTIPVTVNDSIDPNSTFTTDKPLTQTFAPGVTNILITAHDMAGNIATSSIAVTVYSSPTADPDGDGVPNQDDVKPFDTTVFANLTIPDEYSLWEKDSFNLPFSVAGRGNVSLNLSNTYYRVGNSPVKDSNEATVPATVATTNGVITISFPQSTKELKTYTLTLTTTKGNTKERESIKHKRDHESDNERRNELEKELKFANAEITLSITNTVANKTTSQTSTVNIYDKQQTAQLQYKYKDTAHSTTLLLKSDDVLKLKKGQPLELTVKVTGIKKDVPFTTNISGNFTMLNVVQEEEHSDGDDRKQTKFSLFFPQGTTAAQENIIITTTVNGITQTDVVEVRFGE